MSDAVTSRRWLLAAIVAYVLVLSVAINLAGPVLAWGVGVLGGFGLAVFALRVGRA